MKLLGILSLALLFSLTGAFAKPHGNLHDAEDALRKAKSALDPHEDLRTAQHHLENALEYAKGQPNPEHWGITKRRDALDQVKEALKALDAGDKGKAAKCMDQALKLTSEAVGATPKK